MLYDTPLYYHPRCVIVLLDNTACMEDQDIFFSRRTIHLSRQRSLDRYSRGPEHSVLPDNQRRVRSREHSTYRRMHSLVMQEPLSQYQRQFRRQLSLSPRVPSSHGNTVLRNLPELPEGSLTRTDLSLSQLEMIGNLLPSSISSV